jgi:hypothetical protein
MDLNGLFDSGIDVVLTRIFGEHQVDRERSTGDDENGHVAEEIGEFGRIHRGRSDDQLQILATSYHLNEMSTILVNSTQSCCGCRYLRRAIDRKGRPC